MSPTYKHAVRPTYDYESDTYHFSHDPDSTWMVSTSIVLSLQSLTGEEATEMPPLSRAVDADELERHVSGEARGAEIEFEFYGFHVTVQDDGKTTIAPAADQNA